MSIEYEINNLKESLLKYLITFNRKLEVYIADHLIDECKKRMFVGDRYVKAEQGYFHPFEHEYYDLKTIYIPTRYAKFLPPGVQHYYSHVCSEFFEIESYEPIDDPFGGDQSKYEKNELILCGILAGGKNVKHLYLDSSEKQMVFDLMEAIYEGEEIELSFDALVELGKMAYKVDPKLLGLWEMIFIKSQSKYLYRLDERNDDDVDDVWADGVGHDGLHLIRIAWLLRERIIESQYR